MSVVIANLFQLCVGLLKYYQVHGCPMTFVTYCSAVHIGNFELRVCACRTIVVVECRFVVSMVQCTAQRGRSIIIYAYTEIPLQRVEESTHRERAQ